MAIITGVKRNELAQSGTFADVALFLIDDIKSNKGGLHSEHTLTLALMLEWKLNQWLRSQTTNPSNSPSSSSSETPKPERQEP